jgi:hypothetical protein
MPSFIFNVKVKHSTIMGNVTPYDPNVHRKMWSKDEDSDDASSRESRESTESGEEEVELKQDGGGTEKPPIPEDLLAYIDEHPDDKNALKTFKKEGWWLLEYYRYKEPAELARLYVKLINAYPIEDLLDLPGMPLLRPEIWVALINSVGTDVYALKYVLKSFLENANTSSPDRNATFIISEMLSSPFVEPLLTHEERGHWERYVQDHELEEFALDNEDGI